MINYKSVKPVAVAKVLALVCSVYLASYLGLSSLGSYSDTLSISGKLTYDNGLGIPDQVLWEPLGVDRQSGVLKKLYAPLLFLDDAIWHPPMSI